MITDIYDPAYYRQSKPVPPSWPERDPIPEVLNTDPRPDVPVPAAVVALTALGEREGWQVRIGYSRGPERAVRVGEYKTTEAWGVYAGPAHGWRWSAHHTRTVGKSWSWRHTSIWQPGTVQRRFSHALVTDLQEFIRAHGDVGKPWFKAIEAREADKIERARAAARNRPRKGKEGSS